MSKKEREESGMLDFGLHYIQNVDMASLISKNINYVVICSCGKKRSKCDIDGCAGACFVFHVKKERLILSSLITAQKIPSLHLLARIAFLATCK